MNSCPVRGANPLFRFCRIYAIMAIKNDLVIHKHSLGLEGSVEIRGHSPSETSHVLLAGVSGGFSPGTPVFAPPTD